MGGNCFRSSNTASLLNGVLALEGEWDFSFFLELVASQMIVAYVSSGNELVTHPLIGCVVPHFLPSVRSLCHGIFLVYFVLFFLCFSFPSVHIFTILD